MQSPHGWYGYKLPEFWYFISLRRLQAESALLSNTRISVLSRKNPLEGASNLTFFKSQDVITGSNPIYPMYFRRFSIIH